MKKIISIVIMLVMLFNSMPIQAGFLDSVLSEAGDSLGVDRKITSSAKKILKKNKENTTYQDEYSESICRNTDTQKYIENLLNKLKSKSPEKNFSINILRTSVVQALIWLNLRNIDITRGMFNMIYNEDELACLIGHEIGHYILHSQKDKQLVSNDDKKTIAKKATSAILSSVSSSSEIEDIKNIEDDILKTKWSQEEESDADKYGAELAAKCGYNPYAFCNLFERLASRVDMNILYRLNKLEGTHPALDKRAESLRKHLKEKGYKEKANTDRKRFVEGMKDLAAFNPERTETDINKNIEKQAKKDIKQLDKIINQLTKKSNNNETLTVKEFCEIIEDIAEICKKYNITEQDIFQSSTIQTNAKNTSSFMEEKIEQDTPFFEMFDDVKAIITGKIKNVFNILAHIGVGTIPVLGDTVDLYEVLSGKDAFTQEKLTKDERVLTALGLLIGSGAMWRSVADGISGLKDTGNIIPAATGIKKLGFLEKNKGKTYYRYISEEELNAIKETGLLRGGRDGETYFTTDIYTKSKKAMKRLALNPKNPPKYRLQFKIENDKLNLEKEGTAVQSKYGQPGGGSEFMTEDKVKVTIVNIQDI